MMKKLRWIKPVFLAGVLGCLAVLAGGCTGVGLTLTGVFDEMFLADTGLQENAWTVVAPGGNVLSVKVRNDADRFGIAEVEVTFGQRTETWNAELGPGILLGRIFDIPEAVCQSSTEPLVVAITGSLRGDSEQNLEFVLPLILIRSPQDADLGVQKFRDFGCGDTIEIIIQTDPTVPAGHRLAARIFRAEE